MASYQARFAFAVIAAAPLLGAASANATILSTFTSDGYIFTNFDPTFVNGAVGSNANGISNTGQIVGTEVNANNNSVFINFAGTPQNTNMLNTGPGQTANGINSAGNESRASLSWDGTRLMFGTTRAGGEGSADIWTATREK